MVGWPPVEVLSGAQVNIVGRTRPRDLSARTTSAKPQADARLFPRTPVAELISVIVTTYNREDALEAVLRSLARQTDRDFEVVVADDGSAAATGQLVEAWKAKLGHRLEHVWHEDRGFRAAEIRNRAILAARGAYCIFLDGDCIVRPNFAVSYTHLTLPTNR